MELQTADANQLHMSMLSEAGAWADVLVTEERRSFTRHRRRIMASLCPQGCVDVYDGLTDDVSESGARVCLSQDAGLRVGMRCEVSLRDDRDRDADPLVDGVYATVLRTERVGDEVDRKIVVGLRFDQPLFL